MITMLASAQSTGEIQNKKRDGKNQADDGFLTAVAEAVSEARLLVPITAIGLLVGLVVKVAKREFPIYSGDTQAFLNSFATFAVGLVAGALAALRVYGRQRDLPKQKNG